MCGLVGVFGNLMAQDLKFFTQALIADYFRGVHSTGMMSVKDKGNSSATIAKEAVDPIRFLDFKSVDSQITVQNKLLAGHNRHATLGAINANNAHPFTHGDITLMHNGTLDNKRQLTRKYDAPEFDTDSELVCYLIDNYELSGVIKDLEGAFTLIWWDSALESLNIIRNTERPLALYMGTGRMYWASEAKMLNWLLDRNRLTLNNKVVQTLKEGVHLEVKFEKGLLDYKFNTLKLAPAYAYDYSQNWNRGNRSHVGSTVTDIRNNRAKEFKEETGHDFKANDTIYAYVTEISNKFKNQQGDRAALKMVLAAEPYTECTAYNSPVPDGDVENANVLVKATVNHISGNKGGFGINLNGQSVEFVDSKSDDYRDWLAVTTPDFGKDNPVKLLGYEGREVKRGHFFRTIDKGCCICDAVLDADAELIDRTVTFVGSDEVVCSDCARDKVTMASYGLNNVGVNGL